MTQNLLLFFLFYEVELIPFYLLISIWGGARRGYAATKFLLYTALSGILILAGFLGLVWATGSTSFAYESFAGQALPLGLQVLLLGVLLVGFGIKVPLVPLHTWLPDTYVAASAPVAILLGGVLAKLGVYGIIRFGLGLFPDAWATLAPGLATWATLSVLYGAVVAIAQRDIKRMVAYSSVGHMGYILLGGGCLNHAGSGGGRSPNGGPRVDFGNLVPPCRYRGSQGGNPRPGCTERFDESRAGLASGQRLAGAQWHG